MYTLIRVQVDMIEAFSTLVSVGKYLYLLLTDRQLKLPKKTTTNKLMLYNNNFYLL